MLSTYFNMQSGFYYELFSNFMGKGDKESFPFAFAATNTPYFKVPYPVGSVGQLRSYCRYVLCLSLVLRCQLPILLSRWIDPADFFWSCAALIKDFAGTSSQAIRWCNMT